MIGYKIWLQSQLKCLIFPPVFLSKSNNNVSNFGKLILNYLPIHEFVGLSSLPALHSFGHLILNTCLAEQLCHCVGCFESKFVQFCNILFYKIVLQCDCKSIVFKDS